MKRKPTYTTVTRLLASLTLGLLLTTTVSCGMQKEPWLSFPKSESTSPLEKLERKYDDLRAQVSGGKTHAEKRAETTALWQGLAAVFIVLAGFGLIYGAALGSQARRVRTRKKRKSGSSTRPSTPTHDPSNEIIL